MELFELEVEEISLSPHQMRKIFLKNEIDELANSIKSVGLLQPLVVSKKGNGYELVSGERRLRAIKSLGWNRVFAVVSSFEKEDAALGCLVENIQRVDLNPLEVANAYHKLMETFSLTQEGLAVRIGKKRSSVANFLRLRNLPLLIREGIEKNELSFGHAKLLLSIPSKELQLTLFDKILKENLSVREVELLLKEKPPQKRRDGVQRDQLEPFIQLWTEKLMCKFGTKVTFQHHKGAGSLEIHWDGMETLEKILLTLEVFDQ